MFKLKQRQQPILGARMLYMYPLRNGCCVYISLNIFISFSFSFSRITSSVDITTQRRTLFMQHNNTSKCHRKQLHSPIFSWPTSLRAWTIMQFIKRGYLSRRHLLERQNAAAQHWHLRRKCRKKLQHTQLNSLTN